MLPLGFVIFPFFVNLISKIIYRVTFLNLFFYGFFFGFGFLIIYLSWIINPFFVYETTKPYAFIAILLPLFLSIFYGLFFLFFKFFKNLLHIILVTPFIFIFTEFCISNFIYGFPWVSNSLILSNNIFGFFLIKYFGSFGSGYIILSVFLLASYIIYNYKFKIFKKLFILIYSPLLLILIIPIFYIFSNKNYDVKSISIDAFQILNPINDIDHKITEKKIINKIDNSGSDIIIFAENNFPQLINKKNLSNLNHYTNDKKKVIIGATTFEDGNYYNSFVLFEKEKIHFFDKQILVPFGEFLPMRKYLNFMDFFSGSIDIKPGKMQRIITTNDNIKILPIICYEIIFNKIFKNINYKGIDILINITNDSWFGNKIGPYQHFYITRVKSLIANRPLIRVSNNGISAIIDYDGKIIKSTKLNQISNLSHKLKIKNKTSFLFFHNFVILYLFLIFVIFLLINLKITTKNES